MNTLKEYLLKRAIDAYEQGGVDVIGVIKDYFEESDKKSYTADEIIILLDAARNGFLEVDKSKEVYKMFDIHCQKYKL